jgi:hypothetical protein
MPKARPLIGMTDDRMGRSQTCSKVRAMSALRPIATKQRTRRKIGDVPKGDIQDKAGRCGNDHSLKSPALLR